MYQEPTSLTPDGGDQKHTDQFLDVFRKHSAVMLLIEPEGGRILDANPAAEAFYGYSRVQLQAMQISDINQLPPEQVTEEIRLAKTGGRKFFTFPHKRADGSIVVVEVWSSLILLQGRKVLFSIIHDAANKGHPLENVPFDAANQMEMEHALRESEERYRTLFDNINDGIYRSTHDGRFVDINPAMVKMFGYSSREEMLQVDIKKELYFSPDERGSHILDTGQREIEVYRMRRKDGTEIWVEDHGNYVHDEAGNIIYHEGLLRDVTERVRAEEALRQSERSLNEAQTIAGLGSYSLDFETGVWEGSEALDGLFGIDESYDHTVEGWTALIHPEDRADMLRYFTKEVQTRHVQFNREYRIVRQDDDTVRWVHGLGYLEKDAKGNLLRMAGTIQDITERRLMEDALRQRLLEMESLYETSRVLSNQMELKTLLQYIVDTACRLLKSASSGIFLYLPAANELELSVDTNPKVTFGLRLKMEEGLAGHVAVTKMPMRLDDYSAWSGRSPQYEGIRIRAILQVPMLYSGDLIGVLSTSEYGDSLRVFSEDDERFLTLFATQAAGAIHAARLQNEAQHRLEQLQTLRTIDRTIASNLDLRITLDIILGHAQRQLGLDAADILLLDTSDNILRYLTSVGFHGEDIETALVTLNDPIAGRSVMERRLLQISDRAKLAEVPSFLRLFEEEGFQYYICIPLIVKGEVKGVLEAYLRSPFQPSAEWIDFFETLAGQAAIAIDNSQMFDSVQRVNMELAIAYEATIENWSRALDLRDNDGEGHTRRVTDLTLLIAKAMNVRDSDLPHIRRGALLHDIGLMGIPDRILLKKGRLTEDETKVMRRHPLLALQFLGPIHYLRPALDIPACHHERWDGAGYPRGLKGEQIPLAARIFAVADAWDALVNPRPHRKPWAHSRALAHIRKQSGKHFDPQVVEVFLKKMQMLDE